MQPSTRARAPRRAAPTPAALRAAEPAVAGADAREMPAADVLPAAAAAPATSILAHKVTRVGFAPITRVNAERREVELCATSEAVDSYGTIFDYGASKDAFARWIGNVREMHEPRAVGRRVSVRFDDDARKVYVRVRISTGAEDTWRKVLDGTLRGASIGASNVTWRTQRRRLDDGAERTVSVATRYDLVELSLVDNPSNPDALGVSIVRDAVPDAALLDRLDPIAAAVPGAPAGAAAEPGAAAPRADIADFTQGCLWPELDDVPRPDASAMMASTDAVTVGADCVCPSTDDDAALAAEARLAQEAERRGRAALASALSASSNPAAAASIVRIPAPFPERPGKDAVRSPLASSAGEANDPASATASATPTIAAMSSLPGSAVSAVSAVNSSASARARGPFSANDAGYPDVGVPSRAEEPPTAGLAQIAPEGNAAERFHAALLGIALGCGCPLCQATAALYDAPGQTSSGDAEEPRAASPSAISASSAVTSAPPIARAVAAGMHASAARLDAVDASVRDLRALVQSAMQRLAGTVGELQARLGVLEAQPMPGGPVALPIEKGLALAPHGAPGAFTSAAATTSAATIPAADQIRALESLAGRLTDPQAQIAVAAELIRLQQERR